MVNKNDLSNKVPTNEEIPLPTPLYRFYKAVYTGSSNVLPHYHNLTEILVYENEMGSAIIDGKELPIKENTVHVIHPRTVHAFKIRTAAPAAVYVLQLKTEEIFDTISGYTNFTSEKYLSGIGSVITNRRNEILDSMLCLMRNPLYDLEMLCRILRLLSESSNGRTACKKDARLLHVFDEIDKRLSEPFSLEIIARETAISRHHLCRIFKKSTGMTLAEYSLKARIEKAMQLLQEGRENITNTAAKCGFQSLSYFSKSFRNATGKTPKNWQRERDNKRIY